MWNNPLSTPGTCWIVRWKLILELIYFLLPATPQERFLKSRECDCPRVIQIVNRSPFRMYGVPVQCSFLFQSSVKLTECLLYRRQKTICC